MDILPSTTTSAATHTMADTITVNPAKPTPVMIDTELVRPAKPAPAQRIALSPVDQIMWDAYVCFLMLFPLSTSSEPRKVYSKLKAALSLTLSELPFIGGYLAPEEGAAGGRVQIKVDEGYGVKFIYHDFTISDYQADFKYSYDELKRNHFPCSAFDPEKIAPVPVNVIVTEPEPAVMVTQANFISGGLILSINMHHKAADALTLGTVLKAWAKHTRVTDMANSSGLGAAIDNLTPRPMDRKPMSNGLVGPQLKDFPEFNVVDDPRAVYSAQTEVTAAAAPAATSPSQLESLPGPVKMCMFHISATRLAHLKVAASPLEGWISTNDAICALLWRHIARARARLASISQPDPVFPAAPMNLALNLAVEARRRMVPALPAEYLGNAVFYCPVYSDMTTVTSPSTPFATIAKLVREAVTHFDSARMRGVIGLIDSVPKPSDLQVRIWSDPMRGLVISSWADMGLYELEWGAGLGKAESVRVPNVVGEGGTPVCEIFPRRWDGGLEVLMCLEEAAIQMMSKDEEFLSFVEWKGM